MSISERISVLADGFGSVAAFADHVGIPRNTVYGWVKPDSKSGPKASDLEKISEKVDVDLNWLINGIGHEPKHLKEKIDREKTNSLIRQGLAQVVRGTELEDSVDETKSTVAKHMVFHRNTDDPISTEFDVESFRERLRQALKKAGGQKHIAETTGIRLSTITSALSSSMPSIDKVAKLAVACEVDLDWLVFGIETRGETSETRPQINMAPQTDDLISVASRVAEAIAEHIDDIPFEPKDFGEAFRDLLEDAIRRDTNDEQLGNVVEFQGPRIARK